MRPLGTAKRQGNEHITVCICTYRRPHLLAKLLKSIASQATDDAFTVSICVVDNDANASAREAVSEFADRAAIPIRYLIEPEQNIARARNRAVENADGAYVAFIDDDEMPDPRWLVLLHKMCQDTGAAGVLGPVLPLFQVPPPEWIIRGKILDRPAKKTGEVLSWPDTRTGNVIMRRALFVEGGYRFDVRYGRGGEDKEFFRRMIGRGKLFVWCDEAVVREIIPPSRCTRSFQLKRALLRGKVSVPVPFTGIRYSLKSIAAILAYLPLLPVLLAVSHGQFMKYLIKACDHLGRLIAFLGLNVIRENYLS
jgi:succinoglycan biosynthesis protein ExoM